MFMDFDPGDEGEEVSRTTFRAVVRHDEPFCFAASVTQDTHASLLLTHLTYCPPTSIEEWNEYYAKHTSQQPIPQLGSSAMVSIAAKVRSLTADNTTGSFVIACFPLDTQRVLQLDVARRRQHHHHQQHHLLEASNKSTGDGGATHKREQHKDRTRMTLNSSVSPFITLREATLSVLPAATDIAANLRIRLDLDASVALEVEGPGAVIFFGEQLSALIPEWRNHRMFSLNAQDKESEMEDEDGMTQADLMEMFRLAR